ncbi:MAG: OmpH family outer membrane protein [Ferruginibacter sp.]
MKNLSITLNVILIAAVAFLYVKVFSGNKKQETASVQVAKTNIASSGNAAIAFVELDSLNDKISYIRSRRTELEGEQRAIETEWQNGYRNLENRKNQFLKRGNSITQQEAEQFQNELMQQQQQIDQRKQGLTQKLSEKSYNFMDDIQKKLKDFLNDYNKDKNYQYILTTGTGLDYMLYKDSSFNITRDVIRGMNEKMARK